VQFIEEFLSNAANAVITVWDYGTVPAWLALAISLWGLRISYANQRRTEQLEKRREESLYRCEITADKVEVSNHNDKNPMLCVTVVRPTDDLTKDSIAPKDSHTFTLADGDDGSGVSVMFKVLKQDWVVTPGQEACRQERTVTAGLRVRTWIHINTGKLPVFIKARWEELRRRI
jgi:hypothetical protein